MKIRIFHFKFQIEELFILDGIFLQVRIRKKGLNVFDREIALSARGPTSGSYCCVVVRTFVLIELCDAILL